MVKKKIPLNAYLAVAALLLLFLYIISFVNSPFNKKIQSAKSALLNPKYKTQIDSLSISKGDSTLNFTNINGIWFYEAFNNPMTKVPADSVKLYSLINDFSQVISLSKVSDKKTDLQNFGFNTQDEIQFTFYSKDSCVSNLVFARQDFTQTKRYVKSGETAVFYEIEDIFSPYLSAALSVWTEPFIISKQLSKNIKAVDIQRVIINNRAYSPTSDGFSEYVNKLLDLRYGGIVTGELSVSKEAETRIILELGNKNEILLEVYPTNDETEYLISVEYFENQNSTYKIYEKISGWTYSKLNKI